MTACRHRRGLAALIALTVVAAACGSSDGATDSSDQDASSRIAAEFGSYDRSTDRDQRVLVGLLASDEGQVAYGTVTFRFAYRGTRDEPVDAAPGPPIEATYRPLPNVGNPQEQPRPTIVAATETRGVYGAEGARFDRPGFWTVLVSGTVDGEPFETESTFEVNPQPQVPAEGDPAPRTRNPTLATPGLPAHVIDSRAHNGPVPDPELHQTSVADAIAARRPVMVVVSTPLFCQSRFCGPITDEVQAIASEYGDRVAFVHLEIWEDHENRIVNPWAAEWAEPRGGADRDLREPWVFAIGPDGDILQRFDNLATSDELRAAVEQLAAL